MTQTLIDLAAVRIEESWKSALANEFCSPYFSLIKQTLLTAKSQGKTIFPSGRQIFYAFDQTPFDRVRVVILGQDPYHGAGQAMGLSFSVPKGVRIPPSLVNIYKELKREYPDYQIPTHGDLSAWASRGVLLLNASLTVEAGRAGSHRNIGWQRFTDAVIHTLSIKRAHLVFMLWGNFAKAKLPLINSTRHSILTAVHPSPLAGGGFIGCDHFRRANNYLIAHGIPPIDWQL